MTKPIFIIHLIFAFVLATSSNAQAYLEEFNFDDVNWFQRLDTLSSFDIQVLYRDRANEFTYNDEGNLREFYFFRSVVYLKTHEAVELYNKIYINLSNAIDLVDYSARVLHSTKATQMLGESALKEGTDDEGRTYNYFAIEGAEKGSIVDYFYVIEKYPSYKGNYVTVQVSDPVYDYRCRIISPSNLNFSMTPINGEMNVYTDTTDTIRRVLVGTVQNLEALKEEPFSNDGAERLGYLYKLKDNYYSRDYNLFTYGSVAQNVYESLNVELDRKSKSALSKFLKKAKIDEDLPDKALIHAIENYIKGTVAIVTGANDNLSDIGYIIDNHVASDYGMTKLLYYAFKKYEVEVEIVLTSNRYELPFSDTIENYAFLDEYLFFFPSVNDYTIPGAQLYRLGIVPYGYIENNGLFIREVKVGELRTGAGKVKFIDSYPKEHTTHDMFIDVNLSEDLQHAVVDMKEVMSGYTALNYQPYYDYVSEEDKERIKESSVKLISENADIKKVEVSNEGAENLMQKEYEVKATYHNSELVQIAGNKVLFKVGELIGPQAEMYQEEERTMRVDNANRHGYRREINFVIPEGYRCVNLKDLEMNIDPFDEHHSLFKSSYKLDGNMIKIVVVEYYDKLTLPKEQFAIYRDVINAAANFNKITLVLEKV